MRDEDHRRARLRPDLEQLHVEPLPRHLVQRAERLVHQEQRGRERQRASDRHALLHASGQLPRMVAGERGELHEVEHRVDALAAPRAAPAQHLERQRDVLRDRAPVVEHRRLEDDAVVAIEPRPPRGLAVHRDLAAGGLDDVADDAQERRLPAPGRPDQGDELALADLEVDALQRRHLPLGEDLRDALEGDDRFGAHTRRSGARLTTSFSARRTARKKRIPSTAA